MATRTAEHPQVDSDAAGSRTPESAVAAELERLSGPAGALLQRFIAPRAGDPLDVRSLYLDEATSNRTRSRPLGRTGLEIPSGSEVSFAAYFNAFPASYWRRWTTLDTVQLRLRVDGSCRVDVYRSKSDGTTIHVRGKVTEGPELVVFDLDLTPFEDGGWYWFDVTTEDQDVTVMDSGWYATRSAPGRASIAIAMTTFNRPEDCVNSLATLGEDPLVLETIRAVVVSDQGTRKVRDAEGFAAAADALGDRLMLIDQDNLGGSGGFARGMYEAVTGTDCEQVLVMDDDIVIEPDSILRSLAFSRFAEHPMLVGGQMLNLQARSRLHSMGEVVNQGIFMWRAAPHVEYGHDFAAEPLRDKGSRDLHRRIDVDYNGWWMCLIPRSIIDELGLPLPLFIKWDDTEYGLRAGRAGHPTATLPGVAIWHMPWSDKDDATDWQAYFHLRNRLVVAAMYARWSRPRNLVKHSLKSTFKHLLSLEYSTVALQDRAIQDFLAGPQRLFDLLPSALPAVREQRSEYADGQVLASARQLPLPTMDAVSAERFLQPPTNPVAKVRTLAGGLVHNLLPAKPEHHERPQLNLGARDARWFLLSRIDGATVATADARGVAFRKRDPRVFWLLLSKALRSHLTLAREWPRLRRQYRDAKAELTSLESWGRVFGK
jgi:galactofuranosylgalactofuranosylrhamnosyl-N-acetylglucosaminyl-diphospho-decaprenol beta-1,5/1,6-galactofuranosyltransferase